jgi:hydroxymethylglutaryl-CoA reductase
MNILMIAHRSHLWLIIMVLGRAPCFKFESISKVNQFLSWLLPLQNEFKALAATTSKHCKLLEVNTFGCDGSIT